MSPWILDGILTENKETGTVVITTIVLLNLDTLQPSPAVLTSLNLL